MQVQKGDIFRNEEINHTVKILDILQSGKLLAQISRNGFTAVHQLDPKSVSRYLLDTDLYKNIKKS